MKALAIIAILVIFAPVLAFGQAPGNSIQIETYKNSSTELKPTEVLVIINGQLQENGLVNLIVSGKFDSNQESYSETITFSNDNPTHVFELDYPFLPNEQYLVSVSNGFTLRHVQLIPLPSAQEETSQKSTEQVVAKPESKVIQEVPVVNTENTQTSSQINSVELVQSITNENEFLKQEVAKKNAVIMEQIKVIQDLALQISNVMYEKDSSKLYFVADNSDDLIKSLSDENEFLKQEVAKKNAVIMEQIKVIQDLASKISNTVHDNQLSYSLI
ncbi:MAG TPA: hypothetical protein VD731_00710 [Nitrosopumilaceae archaeon]|nr:hypothetical protein [Nitrosopumilaceae archaeon]